MTKSQFMTIAMALCLTFQSPTGYAQSNWKTYTDKQAGYSITYPGFLRQIPWKERYPDADQESIKQWRTKTFLSKEREVTLYLEFHPVSEPKSLEQFFNEKLENRTTGGDHIGYVLTKDNWFVISGVNTQGYEFYEKFFLFTPTTGEDSNWYIYFDFIYPHEQHKIYDPLLAKIAHDFVPNLPGNHEH
jgi:hypothetical protein